MGAVSADGSYTVDIRLALVVDVHGKADIVIQAGLVAHPAGGDSLLQGIDERIPALDLALLPVLQRPELQRLRRGHVAVIVRLESCGIMQARVVRVHELDELGR